MTRLTFASLLTVSLFACGSGSMNDNPAMPGISQLSQTSGFMGRSVAVQFTMTNTTLTSAAPAVDLGDSGITAGNITATSDTSFNATLTIAPTAHFGAHDVTVTTGGKQVTLAGGFTVKGELTGAPTVPRVTGPQGGIVSVALLNQDSASPLNTSGNAVLNRINNGAYSLFTGPPTIAAGSVQGNVLIDALAAPGNLAVTVSGFDAQSNPIMYYSDPADASLSGITARTPTGVTVGTAVTGQNFTSATMTNFYTFSTAQPNQILFLQASNLGTSLMGTSGGMAGNLAPASGKWSDGQFLSGARYGSGSATSIASLALLPAAGSYYVSTYQTGGGSTGYTHDLTFKAISGTVFSAKEPGTPDSANNPLYTIASLGSNAAYYATDGAIDQQNDFDFIRYTTAAGREVFVSISGGEASFAVDLYSDAACSTSVAQGSLVHSGTIHVTAAAGALTGCIRITSSGVNGHTYPAPYTVIVAGQ